MQFTTIAAGMAVMIYFSNAAHAQWLNFQTPDVPRLADGRPDLSAAAPKTSDGKPDLSGVWMHEKTSAEEMKRLFGPLAEEAGALDVPGRNSTPCISTL